VRYIRAGTIAFIPLIAWTSAVTDVEKSLGKLTDAAWLLTTFKVLNVCYDASFLYGSIPVTTRYYWQKVVALSNKEVQQNVQLYRQLDKAIISLEENKSHLVITHAEP
jgi:hypothetical protein